MEISHTLINLIIFVLAIYVGYHVVWTVTPGAAHAADGGHQCDFGHHHCRRHAGRRPDRRAWSGQTAGTLAVALAAVNVFGGFLVTQRMLEMFKKKEPKLKPLSARQRRPHELISMNLVTLLYLVASVCFIQALKGLSHPSTARAAIPSAWRHGDCRRHHDRPDLQAARQIRPAAWAWPGAAGRGGGRQHRRHAGQAGRDDQDAGAGGGHALADRPGGGLHRGGGGGRALGLQHRRRAAAALPLGNRLELFIGTFVGAITFSGSVIAFGKLAGKYKFRLFQGAPVRCSRAST
jgi:NAD(P) transhydrogenase subunit alpha